MMIILRDDRVIETFEDPRQPPNWIETIDIKNQEYEFCDDYGQVYKGKIKKGGFFSLDTYELVPEGTPDKENLNRLLSKAVMIEEGDRFQTLEELKKYLTSAASGNPASPVARA